MTLDGSLARVRLAEGGGGGGGVIMGSVVQYLVSYTLSGGLQHKTAPLAKGSMNPAGPWV